MFDSNFITNLDSLISDDQLLSIDGDSLRLQDGGAVSLDSLESDD